MPPILTSEVSASIIVRDANDCSVPQTRTLRSSIGQLEVRLDGGSKDNAATMKMLSSGQRNGDLTRKLELIDLNIQCSNVATLVFHALLASHKESTKYCVWQNSNCSFEDPTREVWELLVKIHAI